MAVSVSVRSHGFPRRRESVDLRALFRTSSPTGHGRDRPDRRRRLRNLGPRSPGAEARIGDKGARTAGGRVRDLARIRKRPSRRVRRSLRSGLDSVPIRASVGEIEHENARSRRGHRWWRRRGEHPVPPREEGMVGRGAGGAPGADLRLHLACGGAAPAVQHELLGRPDPQVLGRAVPHAGGGDRPERGPAARRQHPARHEPRPDGRVPPVRGGGPHHRGGRRFPDPGRGQGDLAPVPH